MEYLALAEADATHFYIFAPRKLRRLHSLHRLIARPLHLLLIGRLVILHGTRNEIRN